MYQKDYSQEYINEMQKRISENQKKIYLANSKENKRNIFVAKVKTAIKSHNTVMVKNFWKEINTQIQLKISNINNELPFYQEKEPINNYFSDEKVAVYTCVFGKYDTILEPKCTPNNVDFYIITDLNIPQQSLWKPLHVDFEEYNISKLSNAEKNRFFKMHPNLVFPGYNYSVYVDGNVEIVADPTAFINCIGSVGIAMHRHSRRKCVYDEITACKIYKRDTKKNLRKQYELLINQKMPHNYGMCECMIIARQHNKESVVHMMDDWWNYYRNYSKRDQLSFPLVLYKNGIKNEDVATLGQNVNKDYKIRIVRHEIIQKVNI